MFTQFRVNYDGGQRDAKKRTWIETVEGSFMGF